MQASKPTQTFLEYSDITIDPNCILITDVKVKRQNNTEKGVQDRGGTERELRGDNGNQGSRRSALQVPVIGAVQTIRSRAGRCGGIVLCNDG